MGPNRFSLLDFGATPAGRHIRRPPADPRKLSPRSAAYRRHHPNPTLRIPRWARLATTCTVALALVAGGITTAALGAHVAAVDSADISFASLPVEAYPLDHNRVRMSAAAEVVLERLANDERMDGSGGTGAQESDEESSDSEAPETETTETGASEAGADDALLQEDARSEDTSGAGTDSTDSTAEATDGAGASGASATPEVDLAVRTADGALCG